MPAPCCCGGGGTEGKATPWQNCPRAMARICFPEKALLLHHFRQNLCSYHLDIMEILDNTSPKRNTERQQTQLPAEHVCTLFEPERWSIMTWLWGLSSRFAGCCTYDYTCPSLGGCSGNLHVEKTPRAEAPWLLGLRARGAAGVHGLCPPPPVLAASSSVPFWLGHTTLRVFWN